MILELPRELMDYISELLYNEARASGDSKAEDLLTLGLVSRYLSESSRPYAFRQVTIVLPPYYSNGGDADNAFKKFFKLKGVFKFVQVLSIVGPGQFGHIDFLSQSQMTPGSLITVLEKLKDLRVLRIVNIALVVEAGPVFPELFNELIIKDSTPNPPTTLYDALDRLTIKDCTIDTAETLRSILLLCRDIRGLVLENTSPGPDSDAWSRPVEETLSKSIRFGWLTYCPGPWVYKGWPSQRYDLLGLLPLANDTSFTSIDVDMTYLDLYNQTGIFQSQVVSRNMTELVIRIFTPITTPEMSRYMQYLGALDLPHFPKLEHITLSWRVNDPSHDFEIGLQQVVLLLWSFISRTSTERFSHAVMGIYIPSLMMETLEKAIAALEVAENEARTEFNGAMKLHLRLYEEVPGTAHFDLTSFKLPLASKERLLEKVEQILESAPLQAA